MAYDFKTEPYRHQREALNVCKAWLAPEFFWRMDMGTGKTKVAIDNAGALFERGKIRGLFVVAPNTVCRNWAGVEIPAHLPDRIARQVLVWRPKADQRAQWRDDWAALKQPCDYRTSDAPRLAVFVMNHEALATVQGVAYAQTFLLSHPCLFVFDESTAIKNPQAKRTKAALKLAKLAPYRRAMSGLPVVKNPLDLWSQCEFLQHGILGDTSFYSFRARYCQLAPVWGVKGAVEILGYRDLGKLRDVLNSFSFAVTKEECLDLPPKVYTKRYVPLTDEQARIYKQMAADFEVFIGSGEATAPNVLVRLLRMQQILCGYLPLDDGKIEEIPSLRLHTLIEAFRDTDAKAIVWAPFRRDVERIASKLATEFRTKVAQLHGDVSADGRAANIHEFQNNPDVRFIVGTPQTGGVGVTLTAATVVVYYANTWDLGIRAQSEDRAHRIGQKSAVTYIDLVAPDTIDETILDALRAKRSLAEAVTGSAREAGRRGWL